MKRLFLLLAAIAAAAVLGFVLLGRHGGPYTGGPYTGPAVHAPLCGDKRLLAGSACRSPDGLWTVALGPPRADLAELVLTRTAIARKTVFSSGDCCGEVAWARPHRLVFTGVGGYSAYMLDPATLKATYLGDFSNIYASPDGRWVLGDVYANVLGKDPPTLAGLVSVATGKCFAVPGDSPIGMDSPFKTGFTPDGSSVVVGRFPRTWRYTIRRSVSRVAPACSATRRRGGDEPHTNRLDLVDLARGEGRNRWARSSGLR